jgi:BNR/Asp-box repeat.
MTAFQPVRPRFITPKILNSQRLTTLKTILFLFCCFSAVLTSAQVKPTAAADRLKVRDQRKLLEQRSMFKDIPFRNIGPTVMSGRVVDLEVNPEDPTEFYVAYASGGVWYTKNNGQSFEPIFDSLDVITIGDIAVFWDGSPASSRTVWVGTGEVNSSRSSYAGDGVYKTSNHGKTWEYLGLPESHHIGKILLHPNDKNTAWVGAMGHLYSANKERGVFKTTDGGKTWKHTLYIDDNTGVVEMEINPSNPNEIYAAAWYRTRSAWNFEEGNKTSGIYKSTDGGETWQNLTGDGKSGFPAGEGVGRIGLAVFPKNPQIVYAVVDNNFRKPDTARRTVDTGRYELSHFEKITKEEFARLDDKKLEAFLRRNRLPAKYTAASVKELVKTEKVKPTALYELLFDANAALFNTPIIGCEVYRSNDGGKTWKKTHEKDINIFSTYGYYFAKIYVSPYNENKLVNLGITAQLSTDGGKTWKTMDKGNVHADHHALWINPKRDSHIINGNDGGVNITYDDGDNWFKANTPPVGQFYAVTVDNNRPYNVYGGLQDNGVWMGPSNYRAGPGWIDNGAYPYKRITGGDGMQVQVDTTDNTIYAGTQFGSYTRRNASLTQVKSVRPQTELGSTPLRFNWQTPILLSRHNPSIYYIGSNKLHRSMNRGDDIETLTDDLTNGKKDGDVPFGTLTTIDESPLRFGLLYVGTDDGNVHVSKDGGYTWTNISKKLPQGLWVSRVVASKYKEGRVYVTLNGYRNDHFLPYLFVSEDYGENWKALGKDLPFEPLNVVREDPKYDSILYVGSDGGLYVSIDGGNSFSMWNAGLPRSIPVHDIAIQVRDNDIVLGTHGRSLYVAKLDNVQKLLKDPAYRAEKQAKADEALAAVQGLTFSELFKRDGIEVPMPSTSPAKGKKKGK